MNCNLFVYILYSACLCRYFSIASVPPWCELDRYSLSRFASLTRRLLHPPPSVLFLLCLLALLQLILPSWYRGCDTSGNIHGATP
ncbi:hypothetical protein E2C01_098742 [Portunus trituberculatus]|uniref:Uncharacterized protein n=1 Tax=Portunus trituberculatus TaxID=210409 RepID=A0A5B7K201_PORTR|nr:hypothetical protein [Portunus trituberculatus]